MRMLTLVSTLIFFLNDYIKVLEKNLISPGKKMYPDKAIYI